MRASEHERGVIRAAFEAVCDGWSPDRVIADPQLNIRFVNAVHTAGMGVPAEVCNLLLLNLRKLGKLRSLGSRKTHFPLQSAYQFAAEIAIRLMERRSQLTLDQIICNPTLAKEFDVLCAELAPGQSSLEYRWAALSLRKTSGLKPELLAHAINSISVQRIPFEFDCLERVPSSQGLYLIQSAVGLLYVGEAIDLQERLRKHVVHSDNPQLARWIWDNVGVPTLIEYHVLPLNTQTRLRKAMELEIIRSRRPLFNVRR